MDRQKLEEAKECLTNLELKMRNAKTCERIEADLYVSLEELVTAIECIDFCRGFLQAKEDSKNWSDGNG